MGTEALDREVLRGEGLLTSLPVSIIIVSMTLQSIFRRIR